MHIPDSFLSVPVAGAAGVASLVALAIALERLRNNLGKRYAPLLGLTTAFIFAAQMINFPVFGGTSGHLLGGTLAAIILGSPWAGMLSIATVLIIQAVLFADGGITALGANILNMAVIGVWVGWLLAQTLHKLFGGSQKSLPLAAGIAAGLSVFVAAITCAIQLAISGTAPAKLVLPAMAGIHILIGVGEGSITGGIIAYLINVRPDLLPGKQQVFRGWLTPIVSIFVIAGILSLFVSAWPDGLEKVSEDLGFINLADTAKIIIPTPLADYGIKGLGNIGTSITGLIGSTFCFIVAFGLAKMVKPKNA
ncbi:Substrate-specific component NikM of nickel ECF transporter / Additional substrate-specific component NikN of nickel ECF transporter [Richelia intracellularis HM01]|uniref:energy-coupling factor ABC transporter permease n=1 Tax=Richelia intracellularis TaxID=1164990 RepID=UPI0002B57499|nr:energy-coupling factor ABC transporter permease [Richelia intracellularis]CCH66076.1 Substrate-specific component NikM of nickel ECF transporter / Additional substrate-specific component NikN of nickel ECF transporter [Richelia intracellularis HM01]